MFCENCGIEIKGDASFCPNCGCPISNSAGAANEENQTQGGLNPHVTMVTDVCKSPLVLALAILLSATFLFSLIGMGFSFFYLLGLVFLALLCIGCWIVYARSAKNSNSKTGFSVLRVGVPLYMVYIIITFIVQIVVLAGYTYGGFRVFAILAYLIELILYILVFSKFIRMTNSAYKIMDGEDAKWKVDLSAFGLFTVLGIFDIVFTIYNAAVGAYYYYSFVAKLSVFINVAIMIVVIGILYVIRKKSMETHS